jgi:hypothetical protein
VVNCRMVRPCTVCSALVADKLEKWIDLLEKSGQNTKKLVRDQMEQFLNKKLREGGETR